MAFNKLITGTLPQTFSEVHIGRVTWSVKGQECVEETPVKGINLKLREGDGSIHEDES
jgi:hypothetical protein